MTILFKEGSEAWNKFPRLFFLEKKGGFLGYGAITGFDSCGNR